ncbi:glucose 1-dehydrogenase [Chloroflexota bacterium]
MNGLFEGKVALVTGSGAGLGRASAIAFARDGASVVVADINAETGPKTVQVINNAGGKAIFVETDVTKANEVEAMVNKAVETYGRLDCAHNNVGIEPLAASIIECTEEQWDHVIATDLKSVWLCLKYEITYMVDHGGGAIVNTSSIAGLVGPEDVCEYIASKHGVNGLTKAVAMGYAKRGIRVNAVCPAGMRGTEMYQRVSARDPEFVPKMLEGIPMKRDAEPEEVAEAVIWLCSDKASYVTGCCMAVDGGFTAQ